METIINATAINRKNAIQTLSSKLSNLNTSANTHVSFSVTGKDKNSYPKGDVLKFNSIVSNPDNAYNSSTGEFKAPVAGTYFFTVSVNCYDSTFNLAYFYLKCDSTVVMTVITRCATSATPQSASGAAIAHVTQGGVCRVEAALDSSLYFVGSSPGYTNSFTGFLLFQN